MITRGLEALFFYNKNRNGSIATTKSDLPIRPGKKVSRTARTLD